MSKGSKLLKNSLARIMKDRQWKQKDLAKALHLQQPQVSRLLSDDARDPQMQSIIDIATTLGYEPWELLKPDTDISLTPLIREAISLLEQMDDNTRRDALQTLRMYALASKHRNEKIEGSGSSG